MKKNIATNRNRNYYIKLACLLLFSVQFSTLNTTALASSHADKEMLTILLQDKTLKEVFSYIEKHSSYIFIYEEAVNLEKKVSVNFSAKPVDEIIKEVFSANGLSYTIKGRQIIIKRKMSTNRRHLPPHKPPSLSGVM